MDQMSGVDAIPSDIVISTNGGYPLDQNIYQSVKGMTAAEASCNSGGSDHYGFQLYRWSWRTVII